MDIDMLRKGKADQASLIALVDGLTFHADSVASEEITKDSEYKGPESSWTRAWTMCVSKFRSTSVWATSWCPARE
jgi:hypothetical protein